MNINGADLIMEELGAVETYWEVKCIVGNTSKGIMGNMETVSSMSGTITDNMGIVGMDQGDRMGV